MNLSPRYPLGKHEGKHIVTASQYLVDSINLPNLMSGQISPEDLQIHAATLLAQAEIAQQAGFDSLAENFFRAAELTRVPNSVLLAMYEALRPGRSTQDDLSALAIQLENGFNAPRCAAFVRQAADVYQLRGILHSD